MRVLHILSSLHIGGAERFAIDLSKIQSENGLNSAILSLGCDDEALIPEIDRLNIPLTVSGKNQSRLQRYKIINRVFKDSDVIHIHSPYALRFLMLLIFINPGKRYIYTRHGLATLDTFSWKLLHQVLRPYISWVTFVTSKGQEVFQSNQRWNKNKLISIDNGVYIPVEPEITNSSPIKFGSVCRMVELKGQSFLLDAVKEVEGRLGPESQSQYEVHFYGTGPLDEQLKNQAASLSYPKQVIFHGNVLNRDEIYQNLDVLIVSSETEGLSMVVMEAMARKVCVIATAVGGNPSLVIAGENGELISYKDTNALADNIIKLINDSETRLNYRIKAREYIKDHYSLETTHAQFLKCYSP